MHKVTIRPQWSISRPADEGTPGESRPGAVATPESVSPRLISLLVQVADLGSLAAACQKHGHSYRYAWDIVRHGEAWFGAPLLRMERGRGSTLTPLAEKLVWADRRIAARLAPVLDSLASELEVELRSVVDPGPRLLRVHASHGFAIERMLARLGEQGVDVERRYTSAQEAAAALHDGACDLAGLHVPHGPLEARGWAGHAAWLDPAEDVIVDIADRVQGLMVAAGNPLGIRGLADVARPGVRFINRQRGSGTRFLLDCLLDAAGIDPEAIPGYEQAEYTHAAVAAYVGSGMADAGFGLELPARHFALDFMPLATERYFLLCKRSALASPQVAAALSVLRDPSFQGEVNALAGYSAARCGLTQPLGEAYAQAGFGG
jgi:molybdate transport repressor ModE-like protein